jgi:hypothetical protein
MTRDGGSCLPSTQPLISMREALSLRGLGTYVFWRIRQAVRRFLRINKSQMEVNRFNCYVYSSLPKQLLLPLMRQSLECPRRYRSFRGSVRVLHTGLG